MYTLRVSYMDYAQTAEGVVHLPRDYYCRNLSTDKTIAYKKAIAYVEQKGDDAELVDFADVPTLESIYRRNQEELEKARKIAEETAKQAEAEYLERQDAIRLEKIDLINLNIWPFGMYRGNQIGSNDEYSYIQFMANLELDDIEDSSDKKNNDVMIFLQEYLKEKFPKLFNLPKPNGKTYGTEKSRETLNLTLVAEFSFESIYYGFCCIQKFVKDTGELIVYKGASPVNCKLGDEIKLKATIKGFNEYEGEIQTMITRPKLL